MSEHHHPKKLVQGLYEAFQKGDLQAHSDHVSPDLEFVAPNITKEPVSGIVKGRDEVLKAVLSVPELLEIQSFETKEFVTQGNTVAVFCHLKALVKSTGRHLDEPLIDVWTVQDGKVTRRQTYFNSAVFAAAFADHVHHHNTKIVKQAYEA